MISFGAREMRKQRYEKDLLINRVEITEKHFKNLVAIASRNVLLETLPKEGIIAEIGVFKGDFSASILKRSTPKKLFLIDRWNTEQFPSTLKDEVRKRFEKEIVNEGVIIVQDSSILAADRFSDNYFDWIYLDTDHSYEVTLSELVAYKDKIKPGGFITGHDFILGNWKDMVRYGVKEAVYEFCVKYDWELIYMTMENKEYPSFGIRQINDKKM